jgi:hypothetical protein
LKKVVLREGINQADGVTMERFRGTGRTSGAGVDVDDDVELASFQ